MKTVKPDHSKVRYVQLCAETIASRTKNEEFWKTENEKTLLLSFLIINLPLS